MKDLGYADTALALIGIRRTGDWEHYEYDQFEATGLWSDTPIVIRVIPDSKRYPGHIWVYLRDELTRQLIARYGPGNNWQVYLI